MASWTKWIYITKYVDMNTGEQIHKKLIDKKYYIKVKTHKHVRYTTSSQTYGIIEYTTECKPNPEQRLFD